MKKKLFIFLLTVCLLLSLTACKEEMKAKPAMTDAPTVVEITEAVTESMEAPTESVRADQLKHLEDHKVTVGFLPTGKNWQYVDIEDQEAAVAAFEKAISASYSDEWWIKGDRTLGLQVEYQGEIWEFVESGELVYPLGRVKAEDAADLYNLCMEAARAAGWKEALKPEQFTGIVSATLHRKGNQYPLTEGDGLDKLETMLQSSRYVLGGTGCPFNCLLEMTLETGAVLSISLATDSCGAWRSEGYYYEYGNDSQPLYDLFGVLLEDLR